MISLLVSWVCAPMEAPGSRHARIILHSSSTRILVRKVPSPPRKPGMACSSILEKSISISFSPLGLV